MKATPTHPDGEYLTTPIHGNPNTVRRIRIVDAVVHIGGHFFEQDDFFRVNRLANNTTPAPTETVT